MKSYTRMPEVTFTIQEWLARSPPPTLNNKPLRYAKWWIGRQLVPAQERVQCLDFEGGHRLYVTIAEDRYRVVNVNRFGELRLVQLTGELPRDDGKSTTHTCRVMMRNDSDFTGWSNTAEGPLDESKFVPYIPLDPGSSHCPDTN